MIAWLNGELCAEESARIDPNDRGFTLGDGLFETIAVRGSKPAHFEAHCVRLARGCDVLGIPYPIVDLGKAINDLIIANKSQNAVVRVTLSRGVAARGLVPPGTTQPTLLITAATLPGSPPPARGIVATVTRRNEHSPLARVKTLNYLDNILARREAVAKGANEAILLNTAGRVAESTVANIFAIRDRRVYTPPIEEGALPGVIRAVALAAFDVVEKSLSVEDIQEADGVFLTNSLGIRPLASLDGKPMANTARAFMEEIRSKLIP